MSAKHSAFDLNNIQLGFNSQTLAIVGVALLAISVVQYMRYARGQIHLPGPTPLPIFGNLLSLDDVSLPLSPSHTSRNQRSRSGRRADLLQVV